MFRPIRRKKREINIEDAKMLLQNERRGVLAVHGDDDYPYAIPINYYYDRDNDKIYFHGARAGHKFEAIKRNNKVCFTVYGNETVKDEEWAPYMQSIVVFGRCYLIDEGSDAVEKLRKLAKKYYPSEDLIEEEISADGKAVQMYEIEIEHMSGKQIQER